MTRVIDGPGDLRGLVDTRLAPWLLVDQERIDDVARITGDDQ